MTLVIGSSVVDILLMEKIIRECMEEHNIFNIYDIEETKHEKIIQERYDTIMKGWKNDN